MLSSVKSQCEARVYVAKSARAAKVEAANAAEVPVTLFADRNGDFYISFLAITFDLHCHRFAGLLFANQSHKFCELFNPIAVKSRDNVTHANVCFFGG